MSKGTKKSGKKGEPKKIRHPWRENIEALTIAVVVALLFKYFILMGNPETGVYDRVLVDKLSLHFRDPRRFEIVVFKHPLERSRIMVKRLVGMPGEELRILHGDLWTRPDAEAEWSILRRPAPVQEEMWKPLDPDEPARSSWSAVSGAERWRFMGRAIEAQGGGHVQFRDGAAIRDQYLDGYPDSLRGKIRQFNQGTRREYVGDLRIAGRIRPEEGVETLGLTLTEGARTYEFHVPGPSAPEGSRPEIRVRQPRAENVEIVLAEESFRLRAGRRVSFAAENLDDRLTLEINGEVVASFDVPSSTRQEAAAFLRLEGAGADLTDLQVYRDIYYLPPPSEATWEVVIPDGHYVMLGDNTQDSADGRDWKAVRFDWEKEDGSPRTARGNYRAQNENPTQGRGPEDAEYYRFRDEWGDKHWFPKAESEQGLPFKQMTVPRELIQGRAVAVFWPVKPHKGLYRLGWLP